MKRILLLIAALAVAACSLMACSSAKSYPDQITLVVGNGVGDNHKVKKVVYPGDTAKTDGDETSWYLPAGARNYVLRKGADRDNPSVVRTGASEDAKMPSMQDNVFLTINWALNQNQDTLKNFAVFCGKYTCYDSEPNQDHSNEAHSSSAGWFNMLNETFSPAIDRAALAVAQKYPPTLWSDQSLWAQFGKDVATQFMAQLKTSWATISDDDFFCGNGDASRTGSCSTVQVIIDKIEPSDPRIVGISNDQQVIDSQTSLAQAQIEQAKQKYGPYWQYFLGVQDSIAKCADKCTIVIGNPGTIPVSGS